MNMESKGMIAMLKKDQRDVMKSQDRTIAPAPAGDADLDPLKLLPCV